MEVVRACSEVGTNFPSHPDPPDFVCCDKGHQCSGDKQGL